MANPANFAGFRGADFVNALIRQAPRIRVDWHAFGMKHGVD
jgi:hypothetical protein